MLTYSRYLALIFGVGLAIGEAVINWGHWQYAPLWIVDYIVACGLVYGFVRTRGAQQGHWLTVPWAFTCGVFYMALFVSINFRQEHPDLYTHGASMLYIIGGMLMLAVSGLASAMMAARNP